MDRFEIKKFYSQEKLVEKILELSKHREVVPRYGEGFGKRPSIVNFPGDFLLWVNNGATSFHGSVEVWRNPLLIDNVKDKSSLRLGWDLVIDIDSDIGIEYGKVTAELFVKALQDHGIKNISIKFSGSRGFHVAVHRNALPETIHGKGIERWYPQLHRIIVSYLRDYIEKNGLYDKFYDIDPEKAEKFFEMDWKKGHKQLPFKVTNPENNWSSRHLFRMPYSLNEKTWLVSIPLTIEQLKKFTMEMAKPENVTFETGFLETYEKGEALGLVVQALDWHAKTNKKLEIEETGERKAYEVLKGKIPEVFFPPCIKNLLKNGLEDGRKRGLFILLNFLRSANYSFAEIENIVIKWNEKNQQPLRDGYIRAQLSWQKRQNKSIAPPNCFAEGYYSDLLICEPDSLCKSIKNPVSYGVVKLRSSQETKKTKERKDEKKPKKEFICPTCGKKYVIEAAFKNHVEKCFE